MINKELLNKTKYHLLILFIIIQPILDTYFLYKQEVVDLFGFSPATIIRIGIVGVLGIITLITLRNKKAWIIIGSYLALVAVYTVFHILNARGFNTFVPNDLGYSIVGELFYIIRMLIPISVIFFTMTTDISKEDFEKGIRTTILVVSLLIVISNVFEFSLQSYGKEVIKGNIFDWFGDGYTKYNYIELASRGFFNSANQMSGLMVLLLSTMFGIYTKNKSNINLFTILISILAMVMIGTKVALYGAIIIVIIYTLMILFSKFINKSEVMDKRILLVIIASIILIGSLYSHAPSINRGIVEHDYKEDTIEKEEEKEKEENKQENEKIKITSKNKDKYTHQQKVKYIEENFIEAKIKYAFITQHYPYQYDPDFWIDIMDLPVEQRTDYRVLELKMHQRVMDINDNPNDKLFGISFTRTEHLFTLERDFIYQYYSLGIIGATLMLGPYVLMILGCALRIIITLFRSLNIKEAMACFGIVFILGVSVYSGNVMDALTITIILGFIMGQLTKDLVLSKHNDK